MCARLAGILSAWRSTWVSNMRFMQKVEREFNEPFEDVLQGFADMGYGCDSSARMLGYDVSNFRRLLKRHNISINWPSAAERLDAYDRNPWPGCSAMIAARRAKCPLYTHPETGESMIATQWANRIGISTTQFLRRIKAHGTSWRAFAPKM